MKSSRIARPYASIFAFLVFFVPFLSNAQNPKTLEFFSTSASTTTNGPTVANQVVTFRENTNNPTGTTSAVYTANGLPVTVTYSLSAQQYNTADWPSNIGPINPGVFFGGNLGTGTDEYTASPTFVTQGGAGGPVNSSFTSSSLNTAGPGNGIETTTNYGVSIFNSSTVLRNALRAVPGRYQMADLTITFSRPVDNPILHISGLGAFASSTNLTTEFNLVSTGITMTKLSGSTELSVTATQINNSAAVPAAVCGSGGACGSVRFNGQNLSSIVLRVFLRGNGAGGTWAGPLSAAGDVFIVGVTTDSPIDLSILKTASSLSPVIGDNITFNLTASNLGNNNATGVTVTDLLPAGYTFVSATPSTGTYNSGTGVWTIGNMVSTTGTATLSIVAKVNPSGPYANTASIAGNEDDPVASNDVSTVTPVPILRTDLQITKTVNNASPTVGTNVVFTLSAVNNGLSSATGVSVTDVLPAGYTYVSNTAPTQGSFSSGTGIWTVGNLVSTGTASMTITATVNGTGPYANTATITGAQTDPIPGNNSSTVTPVPIPVTDRSVVKTVNNATPAVGSNVVFTLVATNNGPSPGTGITVTDLLPAGYTYVSSTPPVGTTYTPGTGLWTIGALANAGTSTLTITATVNAAGPYANTATIAGTENDPVPANNSSTVTPVPTPTTDRSIVKTVNNSTPAVGSNVVFTLVATNNGPSNGTGITVTDLLPAGYTYVSSTPPAGTTYTPGTGLWNIGALANAGTSTLTITATVNAAGPYGNTATITGTENDPVPANNSSTVTPVPTPTTDRSIVKTVDNATPAVGSNVVFTLIATNNGPSNGTGITVTDLLPAGYTYVSSTPPAGTTYTPGTGLWTIGALANTGTSTLTITATVNAAGPYANTATITGTENDPAPANNSSTVTPVPTPTTDRSIVKTVDNAAPAVGSNVVFTLVATNNGPSNGTGITVTDLLPAGYTYVSSTPPAGTTYTPGTGLWNIGALANTGTSTLTITATVNAAGPYANTATITGTENDPVPANNSSTVTPVPTPTTDRSIVKTVDNVTPAVGSNVVFTLVATNNGPSNGTGITVTDLLPAGYTYVSSTPPAGTTYTPGTGLWTIGALANAGTSTLTITATVNAAGPYANTATITGTENDPVPANNSSTVTPVPTPTTDRSIVKTIDNATPAVGSNVVFTLVATNNGPSDGTGITVTDLLPAGYTYVSSTPPAGTTYTPGTGVWNIGALANTGTSTLTITATVNAAGPYANTATITGTENDPVPANNSSTVTPAPTPTTDRSIVKTVDNATPAVGSNVVFTLVATNNGPSNGTGITVTDLLPAGYTYVSSTPPAGTTYTPGTGLWNIGALANAGTSTLTITATVNAAGPYVNTATITGTENDPVPANNSSTVTPAPTPTTDRSIVKTVDNATPAVGSNVVFTLVATNNGPSNGTGITVTDLLPAGYTYVSSTPPAGTTYTPGTGLWNIGALANAGTSTLTITATVNAAGPYGNTATITGTENDPVPANNSSTVTPVPTPTTDRSIVKTVDNATPAVGSNVVFTLVATNNGPSNGTGITVTDLLPAGYTYVSSTPPAGTTYTPGTGLWNIGALANAGTSTLTITATVNAAGPYANTATITGTENDPVPANNSSTVTPVPTPTTDRSIVKTVDNATPAVGSNVVFTLVATNNGPSDGTGITVTDLLPVGYTYVSSTPPAGTTYTPGTGLWTIGALANAGTSTLTITATVNAAGPYVNTATISGTENDPVPANNSSTVTPVPTPTTDRSIVKTVNNPTPAVGSNVVFTLVATNNGPSNGTGITVTDLLPAGYTYVSSTPPAGTTYTPGTGLWNIGALSNGTSSTLTITASVNAAGPYANTATITGTENDPVPANNSSTVTPVPTATTNLSVIKTVNNSTPYVGNTVTFTLTAANAGPSDATAVVVNDLLPSGYTFVSSTPSIGTYINGTGVWTIGNLNNGANATLTITATVNATGVYTNTATISGAQNDPVPANNTSSITPTPINVQVVKTGPATANTGTTINYVLTVSNNGTGNAIAQSISDIVSADLTNVSWTAVAQGAAVVSTGASGIGNNVSVTGDIPAGGSNHIVINITATIPATSLAASISNTATVTAPGSPLVSSNTVVTTLSKEADLNIQKTGPSTAVAGNSITYILTVTNSGPSTASNVSITDNLPAGINAVTWAATAQNGASINGPSNGAGNVSLSANIPIGTASITVTVNGTIDGSYAGATLVNTATASPEPGATDPTPATSTVTTTISRLANVRITKSGPANIGAGEQIAYTLRIVNDGPSNVTGVQITDLIPAEVLTPTWTATVQGGATISALNGSGNINLTGDVPAGVGVIEIQVTGQVDPAALDGSNFSNTATANIPAGNPVTDPDPSTNTSTVPTTVNNTAALRVSKNGPTTINIGDPITYTIVITNAGAGNITNATISDLVPSSVTVSTWNITGAGGAVVTGTTNGTTNTINTSGDIPAGANPLTALTLTIQGIVNTNALPVFTNTVSVTSGGVTESSVTTAVNQSTDIVVEKSGTQSVKAGLPVSYTIKLSNAGPNNAVNLVVNDLIPSDVQNVSWTATSIGASSITGPISGNTNTIQVTADVSAGAANYILITVNGLMSPSTTQPSITNTAAVTLPVGLTDFNMANNSSAVVTTITTETNLSVVKTVNQPAPSVGTNVIFTLVAANAGPSDGTAVTVTDLLPAGYTYVSSTPPAGTTYTPGTGAWNIGVLATGANTTMTITATVNAAGPYANTATITGAQTDPAPANNSSTVTPVPVPVSDRSIVKTIDNATPAVGSNVVFTLVAANNGPSDGTGITVTDLLPAGYTYVSSTPPAGTTYDPATGIWSIGALANTITSTLTITATVNATGPYANTATITGTESDPAAANNTSTVTPVPTPTTDRSIVKTVDNATPPVGSNVVFTLVATNNGPSNGTGITVTDLLPAGYSYVSSTPPAGTTYDETTGLWTIGALANTATSTLTITATVNAAGPYANTATITGTENDPAVANNTSTITLVPTPTTDRSIVKTVNNASPAVGSNVVFTLVATNNGLSDGTGIIVSDLLPSGYTYISSTPPAGTTYDAATGLWTIGSLANAATSTLTITATVNAMGPYGNTATITGTENDPVPANNTSTVTPVPTPTTDRSIVKTIDDATPAVGSNVVFTLVATNNGPSDGTGITVTDLLPAGYTYVSSTPPAGTTYAAGTGVWDIGALTNGTSTTLTITATVNAAGPYANTATISGTENDPVPGNNTSIVTPAPTPTTDRSLVKTVDNATPAVGSNVVFTLVATNNGPSDGTGITVTDLLPSGYTYVSSTPPAGTTYTSGTGLWNIGALANAATATLTITATVNAAGIYANTATISGTEDDPIPANNTSTVTPVPTPTTDRSVLKTIDNATPAVGSNVVFTLVATNNGPSNGTGITVTDLLPAGYTFVSATTPAGTTYDETTGLWTIGALANTATSTLTITATVNATGPYVNTATIAGTENDPVPANNSSAVTPVPTPTTDRSIVKTIDNAAPAVGSNVVFTLVATNNGPSNGTGITVTDLLPAGYTFVSATPPAGTTYTAGTGIWNIGALANTATATLTITATVNATGPYVNTATIAGTENDPAVANNTSTVTPAPIPTTDRSIVKTVDNATPAVGSNVVFTLVATNNGPSDGTGITVTDLLPAGYTFVSATPPAGTTYDAATGLWTIGALANTASSTLTITATVNAAGPYANTATITGTENDPTPGNNTSTSTPVPTPTTDRSIVKTVDNATPAVGNNVIFTLVASNNGPSDGTGITVTDLLPAGYTYVSSTPPAGTTYTAGTGIWNIGALANTATATLTITATVNATGPYTNTATIAGTENDPAVANNTSAVTTAPTPTTDRLIVKTVDNATPAAGSNVVFTLVATNNGPSDGTGITVTDLLPAGYTYVSSTPPAGTTYDAATGLWTIGALANTATSTLTITATVNAAGPYGNTATISGIENDPVPANNSSTVTPVPTPTTDRSIVKTVDNSSPAVGSNVVFTLVATNNGPSNGTGITVTDLLPAGYTYVSAVPPAGTTYDAATGLWNIGTMTNASTATLTITATVNATGPYGNTATITGTENDPTPGNNTSTSTPAPTPTTDRSLVKTVDVTNPAVGSNVVFTLVATNNGPSDGTGITVTDLLPAGYTYVSSTPPAGTTYDAATGLWNIGTMTNAATATLTITATVNATGPYGNTATITGTENDPTPGNNTSTSIPLPTPTTDRSIVKTVDNAAPAVGSNVVFTLVATNNGPSNGTGITVTDLLPAGYTYVSSTPPAGTTYDAATGLWTIGALANTATSTLSITATVNAAGPYANTTTITGTENDPAVANNSSTVTPVPTPTTDRSLVKTVDNAAPAVGSNVVFTLVATNNGPSDGIGITVTDLLPAGYTYVSSTPPAGTTYDAATGLWNIGTMTNAATATLTITATVNATGPYGNTATITGTENDPTPGNNTSTSTPLPTPTTDRSLVKTVDVANPAVGSNVVFTLVATNNGPSNGTGITVTDLLPAGYTYVSSTPPAGTTYDAATGLWNIGTMTNAATATLTITATVNATGPYGNTATITGTENDPTPGNNTSTSTPVPTPTTDRSLVKTVDNAAPAVGSNVVFTLVATNNGPSDGTGITVTDLLPAGYTYVSSTPPAGTTYDAATGLWNIGTMTNASTATLTITATVNATGPYANTAGINGTENDPTPGNNTSTSTPVPTPTTDRSLVKTIDVANPAVGSNVVFTLVATNNGPSNGTGITVTDLLPAGYTYVSSTPPAGTTYDAATGLWNIGTMTNASTATLTITATVNATGPYGNTATITGTENDPTPGNNTSTSTPTPVPTSDVSLSKTVDNATPAVGSNVVFTLAATNNGPSQATGVAVTDLLPAGYTYVSSTPPAGTTYDAATGLWNIGTITNASTATLTITATVNATGPYANTATITGTENDPTPGNNTSTSTPTPVPTTDRSLVKTVDVANPAVGSNVVFTLVATNNGPSNGTGITVTDLLPAGYTYVSSTPPAGTTYDAATGLWNIGTMTNASTATLTITASVNATGPYGNTATITGTENDPTPGNNTSTSTPTPVPTSDVSLSKTVDNAAPAVGSSVVFTLVATNNGPSQATGVAVTDLLPAGYTYVSATPPAGTTYDAATGLWNIGTMTNAATATLTITATVNATGPYANTASINGTENDPTPGNNTSTSTPVPTPTTDRSLVKTVDNAAPAVGSNVVFTLVATNNGPSDGTGITVTDLLPAGYTYVSSTPPAGTTYDAATGLWNIGTMTNASTATLTITATVNATGPYGNTATITGTENDPTPGNNTSTSTPIPVPTTDRSLVKTVNVANPAVGSNVVFTLVATNNGPSNGTGITVTDLLPAGYTYVSSTPPAGTTYDAATGLWNIGVMTNASTTTLTITATVNATGPYGNTATITGTENDPTPGNNTSTSTPIPVPTSDVSLSKTVDNAAPAVGSNVVFTLVATNNGPSQATGVAVTDLLPAGYTYVSSTPPAGTTYDAATGLWNIGTITNAATTTLTITATVNATGPYANTASITGTENDPTPGNNTSTSTPTPVPTSDVSLSKTVDNIAPAVGSNVVFTLVATNNGPSQATGVAVTDLLPAGYTFVSATPPAGTTYDAATGLWNIGTITNASTATLTITATVNATGPYANTASITGTENDPTPGNNTSTSTPTPVPTSDVSLSKTVDNAAPAVGSNVVFTLVATNNGPSQATGVAVTDLLPAGYTFVSATPPAGTTYDAATGLWNIGTITNASTATLTITATVNATGPYANTASITGTENDPTPGNNTSTSTPTPVPTSDVSLSKTVDNAAPAVGSNVVFTLVATNNGPSQATGVAVTDLLPAGYTYVSSTPPAGTTYDAATGLWTIGTLANTTTSTLTITATVNATGPYANTATITGTENDPTPGNNTSTSTPTPVPTTDRSLVKTVDVANPAVGSNVVFTLVATNNGPSNGTGITVTDLLPAGYTYVSSTPPAGTTYDATTGLWNIGTMTNAATATLTITATVNATGPYANTASITGTENDPTPGNNTSTSTPTPVPTSDVSLSKTVDNAAPAVGSNVVFTLVATNNGPSQATGVAVTDLLPAGYTFVSSTPPAGTTYDPATGLWNIGTMTNASTATLTITATVNATGPYANTASINGTENDPTPGNNTSTSTPLPTPTTDRSLVKTVDNAAPAIGSTVVFTLVATNNGPSNGTGITVTDLLPAGYTYVSSTPPAGTTYDAATGLWNIGTMTNAATATLTITATVNATGPYANTASINGTENDPTPGNNTSTSTPVPTPTTDRSLVKTVDNAAPAVGSNVVFTLVATNNGPSNGTGITVTDLLPAGYTYVSSTPPAGTTYDATTGLWNIGTMTNASTATLTITATVNATGPYGNTATITGTENDPTPGNNTSTSTPIPVPTSDVSLSKTVDNTNPAVGSNVVFTLVATNNGPSQATGVAVTDLLPAGYTYVSSTPPAGTTYNPTTGLWNIGTITNAATTTLTITATVNATGPYANTASINGTENDPTPGNNTSTSTPVPTPTTDRSLVKTVDIANPAVGSNVVFTLVATNNGPSNGTGITVTDLLPAGYTYVSSTPPAGTTYNPATGLWNIGTMTNAATATLTITATVNASGPYANTATITGTENDPTPGNNTSTSTPAPGAVSDRAIVKTVNNATPAAGTNVVFTLVATNNGPSDGTGIIVTDLLPSGYTYVSATPPAGTTYTAATGIWNIGALTNGSSSTLTITARVNGSGIYTNSATISGTENDAVTGNNTATATTSPVSTTGIALTKTGPASINAGSTITYVIVASNNGPSDANNLAITDMVNAQISNVTWTAVASGNASIITGASGTGNSVSVNGNITANSNDRITITITGTVSPSFAGQLSNIATATPSEPGNPPIVTPPAETTVIRVPALSILKSGPSSLKSGDVINYVIELTNTSGSDAKNLTLSDLVPSDIGNVEWTASVNGAAKILSASSGTGGNISISADLPAGAANKVTVNIKGNISKTFTGSLANTARAQASESGAPEVSSNTVATTVENADFIIPNIITPNGDGSNDLFKIKGLENYPGTQATVFNRWGNEVYRSANYLNDWDGSDLNEGTYYYLILRKEKSGSTTTFKGWLFIKR